jgi:single-strand DNA-binding protein
MAGDTTITIIGNLTDDPVLRFTPSGAAVASFTIASTPRHFNKETSEWEDGDPLFLRCSAWRRLAENVCESFRKGDRVIAVAKLKQRSYENKEGQKVTVVEGDVEEVGASVLFRVVKHHSAERATAAAPSAWGGAPVPDEPPF